MAFLLIRPWLVLSALAILLQISVASPALDRSLRHSDSLFTSLLSTMLTEKSVRDYVDSRLTSKRSAAETDFASLLNSANSERGEEGQFLELCLMWLYQGFVNDSLPDGEAWAATQISSRSICPKVAELIAGLTDESSASHKMMMRK